MGFETLTSQATDLGLGVFGNSTVSANKAIGASASMVSICFVTDIFSPEKFKRIIA